ncbi:adenylosuccinate lyase [Robiginitalea sp. SC105]|uniref:adenylosuccinate lyase n=1 Tax=Robiginitalea sp. SC105 TaxID=2762332 RepID=UPI00163987A3|nr:adenylosuccinate lyase [Robiginitalea sp. SC105]MBC2839466.1 adenylosuccinate lyase [Robiginitalea sp. SC105]
MELNSQLLERLQNVDATREKRLEMARYIRERPGLFGDLLRIALQCREAEGPRACWVVEFVFKQEPGMLYPLLGSFSEELSGLRDESSIRPMAKICEMLATAYYRPGHGQVPPLETPHKQCLVETCFDWLIGPHKVATKAYSMAALYWFGGEFGWIRPELQAILTASYPREGAAYRARARQILNLLEKPQ